MKSHTHGRACQVRLHQPFLALFAYAGMPTVDAALNHCCTYAWRCACEYASACVVLAADPRQQWVAESVTMVKVLLRSSFGKCLAIWDGANDRKPYHWTCDAADPRQHWYW